MPIIIIDRSPLVFKLISPTPLTHFSCPPHLHRKAKVFFTIFIFFQTKVSEVGGSDPEAMAAYPRPQSSTSLSPPAPGLVVPQPINPRLPAAGLTNAPAGMRKYPCKMCPQVNAASFEERSKPYGLLCLSEVLFVMLTTLCV